MTKRFGNLATRLALYLVMVLGIAACGGGGGGGGGGGFTGEGSGGSNEEVFISLELLDSAGNPTNTVTSSEPATLRVRLTRKGPNGAPLPDLVVEAEVDIGTLLPDSGTGLTDDNGEADFQIIADGALGAGTVKVTVRGAEDATNPEEFEADLNFQIGQADLRIGFFDERGRFVDGQIELSFPAIPAGGEAVMSMAVVDEFGEGVPEVQINLSSDCALSGRAIIAGFTTTDTRGFAEESYFANGCDGEDLITATIDGTQSTATAVILVASPQANSIEFVSFTPESGLIALKGTGTPNRPETSTVTFKVIAGSASDEEAGTPLQGVPVDFELSTEVGGLELLQESGLTDINGEVQTTVQSGNVSTSVRVTARIDTDDGEGNQISLAAISDAIVVSTGLPDQNSISLSANKLIVPGARETDGITVQVTVRMADKFNNPVADGTSATFTTEYGSIGSSCTTVNGACSVTWTSQAPRFPTFNQDLVRTTELSNSYNCPSHKGNRGPCPDSLGYIEGLRSTVLVTAVGEESFIDANGNGIYDEGEEFFNLPEAFLDHNEDTVYTPELGCPAQFDGPNCEIAGSEETFVDFDGDGIYSLNVDPPAFPNGVYNGSLCPKEGDGIYCSRELLNVRDSLVLVLGSETSFDILLVDLARNVRNATNQGESFVVYIADIYNNPPPGGTAITFTTEGECTVLTSTSVTAPDTNAPGAFGVQLATEGKGSVTVKVSGNNIDYSETFVCNAPDPEPEPSDDDLSTGG